MNKDRFWFVGVIGGIMLVGTSFNVFWNQWGWQTPDGHDLDIAVQMQVQESVSTAILTQQKLNRDEWWCDEESEHLDDLLLQQDAGDDTSRLEQEIREQRTKMEAVACHRFDHD